MNKLDLEAKLAEEIQYGKEQEAENLRLTSHIAELEARLKDYNAENYKLHGRLSAVHIELSDLRKLFKQQHHVVMKEEYGGENAPAVIGKHAPVVVGWDTAKAPDMTAIQVYEAQLKAGGTKKVLGAVVPKIPTQDMVYEGLHALEEWMAKEKAAIAHGALHPAAMIEVYKAMVAESQYKETVSFYKS